MITLISARAMKIEVINNITEPKEIKVDIVHEFHVDYAENAERCRAVLNAGLKMEGHPEILTVICTVIGEFEMQKVSSDEDKKKVHIECYNKIFPYGQALVARLCTDAGLPPFYVTQIEMNDNNIIINK